MGDVRRDRSAPAPLDEVAELLTRLDLGSRAAGARLAELAGPNGGPGRIDTIDRIAVAAAGGSPYALELLVEVTLANDLAGPALSRVLPPGTQTDDVVQEVLVALSRSIHRFRADARYTTWLYALARNVAVSNVRRRRTADPLATDDDLAEPGRRRLSSEVSERDTVRRAIAALPDRFRHIVYRRDIDGLSYAEIAAELGLEVTTVRSRLARGRAMLTGQLG